VAVLEMTIESTNDKQQTVPSITYSECYAQPFFTFYNADNMAIMKTFKDKEFDLCIVDPPYGINFDGNTTVKGKGCKANTFTNKQHHEKKGWDNERPSAEYFAELRRVSKNQIIWGGNYFADLLPAKKGWIFWDKKITNANNTNFSDGELAWTSFDCILRRFTFDWIGFGYLNNPQREKKIHPTQKPVALYEWIIKNYANENDKILDTHLGSGSIAIAIDKANTLDKKNLTFVGIELDPVYYRAAVERFKNHKRQCVLF
jgi:site-specific DNA-methyltransferase (adenine-specific)